jgi:hypothetical protein
MLGRKTYTREELDHARTAIDRQIAAYNALVKATGGANADKKVGAARAGFEAHFFNNLTLVLDRYFVHRVRAVSGKDGNPVNEVEMLSESLMNHDGILTASTVIKLVPEDSVTQVKFGDPIALNQEQFERLSAAFLDEIERRFV